MHRFPVVILELFDESVDSECLAQVLVIADCIIGKLGHFEVSSVSQILLVLEEQLGIVEHACLLLEKLVLDQCFLVAL